MPDTTNDQSATGYKLERVPAGHFILYMFDGSLSSEDLAGIQRVTGVTSIVPGRNGLYVIDVSYEAVHSSRASGRVRRRILAALKAALVQQERTAG